ncbi:MAG: hypothetical protein JXP34_21735 [Planctomycetes bacterium]|nr:hypothetical protein [Planctomycetota bacterium]
MLRAEAWNITRASDIVGISRPTLRRKIRDHGLIEGARAEARAGPRKTRSTAWEVPRCASSRSPSRSPSSAGSSSRTGAARRSRRRRRPRSCRRGTLTRASAP